MNRQPHYRYRARRLLRELCLNRWSARKAVVHRYRARRLLRELLLQRGSARKPRCTGGSTAGSVRVVCSARSGGNEKARGVFTVNQQEHHR